MATTGQRPPGAVEFTDLGKDYAGVPALEGVTAELAAGAATAIIGRSGSGKSTLLKCINGLAQPDRGAVRVFGAPVDYGALPALRRRIGYLVQGGGLFPHLSAGDNIGLLARLDGWPAADIARRRNELLEMVQLPLELAARYPFELSGGQQQRVALCRAMMLDPGILLLDEPFAALDSLTRLEVHEQLLRLQERRPRTLVLVTHDLREALKLADEVLLLNGGRLVGRYAAAELRAASRVFASAKEGGGVAGGANGSEPEQLLARLLEEAA